MTFLKRHKIAVQIGQNSYDFWFLAPSANYDGLTAATTGVTKIADNNSDFDSYAPLCTVEALLKSGVAVRKIISYKVGTRRRYTEIIITKNLADTFVAPASFKGDSAPKLVTPLRSSFS
jgi:hypothetical protein